METVDFSFFYFLVTFVSFHDLMWTNFPYLCTYSTSTGFKPGKEQDRDFDQVKTHAVENLDQFYPL